MSDAKGGSMASMPGTEICEKDMKDVKFCLAFIHSPRRSTREPRDRGSDDVKA